MTNRITILTLISTALLALDAYAQNQVEERGNTTIQADTLKRELILERDYIPDATEAKKTFFNPLDQPKVTTPLKPLSFAKNSYGVSLSASPRLFDPIYNSYAVAHTPLSTHLRLYGGYPTLFGINGGLHFAAGENGTLDIAIDHESRYYQIPQAQIGLLSDNTHDSELRVNFSQKLATRLLGVSAAAYHNLQTYYGLPYSYGSSETIQNSSPTLPLFQRVGGEIALNLSPAPLLLKSPWQYSVFILAGYGKQELPFDTNSDNNGVRNLTALDLKAGANLAYGLKVYNFNFGADVTFEMTKTTLPNDNSAIELPNQNGSPMVLSADPYLSYVDDRIKIKGGVKVQFLNGVSGKFMIAPLIDFRWQAHDLFSLIISADGGGDLVGTRELYEMNRYAYPHYGGVAMDVARWNVRGGFEFGNLNGFSGSVIGGYADYNNLYDWNPILLSSGIKDTPVPAVLYQIESNQNVKNFYLEASARYLSTYGLELSGGFRFDQYMRPASTQKISGRPKYTLHLSGGYHLDEYWSVALMFTGEGGILYRHNGFLALPNETEESNYLSRTLITDLGARVTYNFNRYAGLSLIGSNLLNQKSGRWLFYDRPGIGISAALTLKF